MQRSRECWSGVGFFTGCSLVGRILEFSTRRIQLTSGREPLCTRFGSMWLNGSINSVPSANFERVWYPFFSVSFHRLKAASCICHFHFQVRPTSFPSTKQNGSCFCNKNGKKELRVESRGWCFGDTMAGQQFLMDKGEKKYTADFGPVQ